MKYDFCAIGDITIDAFIELDAHDARVDVESGTGIQRLSLAFGDKVPYRDVVVVPAVGNAPNASVSAARLGLKTGLISDVGNDRNGKDCIATLRNENVHTSFVRVHEDKKTNYHYVLRLGAERTILIKHEVYQYAMPILPKPPRYIYFSSIGENGEQFHNDIADYLEQNPEVKLAFQPGTYQLRLGYKKLKKLYAHTEIFFCNKEEAQNLLGIKTSDFKKLLDGIALLGPKIVVITDGAAGAYVFESGLYWFMPVYPDPKPPVDRTGAGDSFSSCFVAALALGHPVRTALMWAPINSMSVVQYIGAQKGLLTEEQILDYLKKAPKWYRPKILET